MDMEFRILGATLRQCRNRSSHQPHMKYGLTSLRLLQQIASSTQMSKILTLAVAVATFKVQRFNYTQSGQASKVKVSNSRAFSIRGL